MPDNEISPKFLSTTQMRPTGGAAPRVSLAARLTALLRAGQFDRLLAVGVTAAAGSALAVHRSAIDVDGANVKPSPDRCDTPCAKRELAPVR